MIGSGTNARDAGAQGSPDREGLPDREGSPDRAAGLQAQAQALTQAAQPQPEQVEMFRGYPVRVRRLVAGGRSFELLGPDNYEALVDDPRVVKRFEQDEFMPYWAEFWPATLLLADLVAAWPEVSAAADAERPRVLELGCGLGLVSLVATSRGYQVLASDYEDDALAFVQHSARRSGVPAPECRYVDWRGRYDDLALDFIVACEVLYETRNLKPIAEFVAGHLRAGGEALIVDSYRQTADAFEPIARHCGLSVTIEGLERPGETPDKPLRGRVFRLRHKAAESA